LAAELAQGAVFEQQGAGFGGIAVGAVRFAAAQVDVYVRAGRSVEAKRRQQARAEVWASFSSRSSPLNW